MIAAAGIALSGALAQSTRVEAAASNLANQQSRGALSGQPAAYQALTADTVAQTGGGTRALVRPLTPAGLPAYDPSSVLADARGLVAAPAVDPTRDLLTMTTALTAYKANLSVIKTSDEMTRTVLKMTA